MLEFDNGKASAIVEYKNEHAQTCYSSHPSYMALVDLGNKAGLPVFAVRYTDDFTKWTVTPLNASAGNYVPCRHTEMDEIGWVKTLYRTRGREVPSEVINALANSFEI